MWHFASYVIYPYSPSYVLVRNLVMWHIVLWVPLGKVGMAEAKHYGMRKVFTSPPPSPPIFYVAHFALGTPCQGWHSRSKSLMGCAKCLRVHSLIPKLFRWHIVRWVPLAGVGIEEAKV